MKAGRIGIIGGGNMGAALARGMMDSGYAPREEILIAEPMEERRKVLEGEYGFQTVPGGADAARESQTLLFAVKPQILHLVLDELKGEVTASHLLISIVAGAPAARFVDALGPDVRIIRVMPNTPALVGEGAAALCRGGAATPEDLQIATEMLASVGKTVEVPESLMDAVTGLSGSGPAYVFQFIEALADGGVRAGIPREQALLLAAQTVLGSAKMVLETGEHPGRLKDMVASPGGTTIAGLHALERGGLRAAVMDAVAAAADRSVELGKS